MSSRAPRPQPPPLAFDTLTIEGGLLAPEWLARAARLEAPQQAEPDYRVPPGLNLREEIGRAWRIAQAHRAEYNAGRRRAADPAALAARLVTGLLRDTLGWGSLAPAEPRRLGERSYPAPYAALGGRVPVVIAPAGHGLDAPLAAFGDAGRRRSAFGLTQELLNADPDTLWGLCSDGERLRLARDNASLTRPAWIEADLGRIFAEERFADFTALWLLAHESRFGRPGAAPADCPLEAWREGGRQEGSRAREALRGGVEDALVALGQGFVAHPANTALREALAAGQLSPTGYFQELLRLVYRLIFLLTVEERGLLHPERTPAAVQDLYAEGYALRRLRERAVRRSAHDLHEDLWEGQKIVLRGLASGEPRLGLPALQGLFAAEQCPHLDAARLHNHALLQALFRLGWLREGAGLARVNWRDMGPEELGSVYESLLELQPELSLSARRFGFAPLTQGHARKTTGSYYTPDSLVQLLLDSALEPVVAEALAAHPEAPAEALLNLRIVDPSCGSGHFLLAAARRLAAHLARVESEGTPSAADYRAALRRVVGRCIFGVDLNPMAVELCRVALWMEAVQPGLPLGFLDAHLRCGNALLGATPAGLEAGVPDEAWAPLEGDDRKTAASLKRRNKQERSGQQVMMSMWARSTEEEAASLRAAVAAVEDAPDSDLKALLRKRERWAALVGSDLWRRLHRVADAWCAAFAWPKPPGGGPVVEIAPTDAVWRDLRAGRRAPPALLVQTVEDLAARQQLFHWELAFPTVFARGGFDVVLGNPPWEHIELKEEEFFASRDPNIALAANAAARKRRIAELPQTQPQLWAEWCAASRNVQAEVNLLRSSGRFPLCAVGRLNTYALFAEHNRALLGRRGRAGFIVPTGIATDDTTKEYFGALVGGGELASFYSFENEEFVFPAVHHAFRFALLTVQRGERPEPATLVFFARQAHQVQEPTRRVQLRPADFALLNPNTRTCPTFRSRADADLNLAMYRRAGVLWREDDPQGNPWGMRFMQGIFNMASDSGLFRTRAELEGQGAALEGSAFTRPPDTWRPLVEAKMVHQWDHRFGTYAGQTEAQNNQGKLPELDEAAHADPQRLARPQYWVDAREVDQRLEGRWDRGWLLGWRDITNVANQRTVIAAVLPRVAVGHTTPLMLPDAPPPRVAALYANLCSFALDYAARQKVGGTHLTYGFLKQLPILPPAAYAAPAPWDPACTLERWILPRVLELSYTAWDLQPFARDLGWEGPPFVWDAQRRALLRAELDAAFFQLYGLSLDEVAWVLDSFPIVHRNDERQHGEPRTRRLVLERAAALAQASASAPYLSPLHPPPAHPAQAHDPSTRPPWAAP